MEDGIVLSPQRQSFGQGCHVLQSAPERGLQQDRTKTMLSRSIERDTRDGRNRLTGRVGRGSRSMDYRVNPRERTTRVRKELFLLPHFLLFISLVSLVLLFRTMLLSKVSHNPLRFQSLFT